VPGSFTISKMNKDNVLSHIRIDYVPQRGFSLMVQHKSAAGTAAEHNKEEVSVFLVLVCVGVWVCMCVGVWVWGLYAYVRVCTWVCLCVRMGIMCTRVWVQNSVYVCLCVRIYVQHKSMFCC
jgi:hypothetical protein